MSETVRDAVPYPKGWRRKYALAVLEDLGILDAHIYGVCQTCGGTGFAYPQVSGCTFPGQPAPAEFDLRPCPDCKTLSVVTTEVRERAKEVVVDAFRESNNYIPTAYTQSKTTIAIVDAVLDAVLGDVRVAKEIGVRVRPGHMNIPVAGENDRTNFLIAVRGDTIAILED